ncbi:MAG: hypothetical protein LBP59_04765 [Planctomycetaceae bacterium]|jgi:hypothetical protein|nr:hypothetical protein [Planctomycetaceae bacterium]
MNFRLFETLSLTLILFSRVTPNNEVIEKMLKTIEVQNEVLKQFLQIPKPVTDKTD